VAKLADMRSQFAAQIQTYFLPDDATYDEFVNGELPMTIHSHLWWDTAQQLVVSRLGELLFSYGDTRESYPPVGHGWHDDFPMYGATIDFPFLSCYFKQTPDITQWTLGIYPFDDLLDSDFLIERQAAPGEYTLKMQTEDHPSDKNVCLADDTSCLTTGARDKLALDSDRLYSTLEKTAEPEMFGPIYHGDTAVFYEGK
jgi:hypothetical protein